MTKELKELKESLKLFLGVVGDRANKQVCPLILYQPKACRRGECGKVGISKGKAADR